MDVKQLITKLFTYTPQEEYNFTLLQDSKDDVTNQKSSSNSKTEPKELYPSLKVNLEYVKSKYNSMINSDIVIREFTLIARGKQYSAFLLYIDGMINTDIMNKFILEPLMLRNRSNLYDNEQNRVISEAVANNITVRKVKKFNLADYIMNCLMPQNTVNQYSDFSTIFNDINSGNCALFVDTLNIAFDIEVKGFEKRSIEKPENEIVIKGAHEAFVENIRTNTSLIRRSVHNENLIIESIQIGDITKTSCALCYIKTLANSDLVAEVRYRLNNLEIDSMLSSGQLEQMIVDSNLISVPQTISTERPDKATSYLLDGRVVLLVNGAPYALVVPAVFTDFLSTPDDKNMKTSFSNFIKWIRILATFISLLLPRTLCCNCQFSSRTVTN